jgi:aryl-alcohol dehydrogenase-like predicted oxidoreductase
MYAHVYVLIKLQADAYGSCEDIIGKWFADNPAKRKDIFLASKFGRQNTPAGRRINSTPDYCKEACEKSLKRLGVDCIDLYYVHRLDQKTPIEKTVRAMAELKAEGKIKHLGLSECSAESLRRACKVHHIAAVQLEYSPWVLDIESPQTDLLRTASELGVAVVAYSPIGKGMLSGAIRTAKDLPSGRAPRLASRFSEEQFEKSLALVDEWTDLAKQQHCTPAQLCMAWLMAQGDNIIPIPGTTKVERLKENLGALQVKLTKEDDIKIRKFCEDAKLQAEGDAESASNDTYGDTPPE